MNIWRDRTKEGNPEGAITMLQAAIEKQPNAAMHHKNLGDLLIARADREGALACFESLVKFEPSNAGAWLSLSVLYRDGGDATKALECVQHVLALQPDNADAWIECGVLTKRLGKPDEAAACYRQALVCNPKAFRAWFNIANWARDREEYSTARSLYEEALQIDDSSAEAWNNLGYSLQQLDDGAGAMQCYHRAALLQPDLAGVYVNIGNMLKEQNAIDQAIEAYEKALRLSPEQPEAHHSLALALLANGEFARGWKEYEWRLKCRDTGGRIGVRSFPRPLWDGASLEGKRLLVYAEQGLGDTIQFSRFIPILAHKGVRVIFACYPHLLKLLGSLNGIDSLVDITAPVFPGFDVYTALMSVPHVIGLEANMIPAEAPYLFPDPESRNIWTSVVDHQALHVGLVWKTNTANRAAVQRSLPLSELVPLASIPGITWHSLQIGESAELEMKDVGLPFSFVSHPQRVDTMEATAGLVASLDLVISIDTSVAHLAGAMGIPVWTMLPYASDWRWMIHRETTAWYPTMRLYRQDNPGDWSGVVRHIGSDLHCLSNSADTGEEAHG